MPNTTIPILMYHQIDKAPPRGTPFRSLVVSQSMFKWQMRVIKALGYRGLSIGELEPYLLGQLNSKVVGITFDDGFRNVIDFGLPILQEMGFTATAYVLSSRSLKENSWDAAIGVPQKPLMTSRCIHEWISAGMEIGAHSISHQDLTRLSDQEAFRQISVSKSELAEISGGEIRHFCYPYGRFNQDHITMVREAGYQTATTVEPGRFRLGDDWLHMPRVMVARTHHPLLFALKAFAGRGDPRR
ncbi:MAG: polysaccharide deacetylase family protein [Actinomycetota bacterium]